MSKLVAIVGEAGSGKDTFAAFVAENGPCVLDAFAAPFKVFARDVFRFSDEQLYGPSHMRNAPHLPISFDGHPLTSLYARVARFVGLPEPEPVKVEQIQAARDACWARFGELIIPFAKSITLNLNEAFGERAVTRFTSAMGRIMASRNITPRLVCQLFGTEGGRAISPSLWFDLQMERADVHLADGRSVLVRDARFLNEARGTRRRGGLVARVRRSVDAVTGGVTGHVSEQEMATPEMDALVTHQIDNTKTLDDLREQARRFYMRNLADS